MTSSLSSAAARLRSDDRGSTAVITALSAGMLFGMAALSVDVSRFYLLKRQQQTATDLAAMAASSSTATATAAALASLAANGRAATDLVSVEVGTYVPDAAVAPALRFTPGAAAGGNAARVTLRTSNVSFFGSILSLVSTARAAQASSPNAPAATTEAAGTVITTRSIAAVQGSAAFALGSRLAALDGGVINQVLGQLLGARLSFSALDYQALASADVDLFGFANALALRVAPKGATYGALAAMQVRSSDILLAAADAGSARGMAPGAVQVLRQMAAAVGASSPTFTFGSLVSFASFNNVAVGSSAPIAAAIPVLPLVTAAAKLGGATSEVVADLAINLSPIASGSAKIVVGALPIGSTFAAVGPTGTTLHTAQTRLLLTLQLANLGAIQGLNLPLYVEAAPATATLTAASCSAGLPGNAVATLSVQPGAVDGWIGNVTDAALTDTATPPSPGSATLTSVLLASVSGRAHATVSNTKATIVAFTQADVAAGTMKSVATTDYTASLLSGLFNSLQLNASVLGASVPVPSGASAGIANLLTADLSPIDTVLSRTLALLGVTVGDADTWVRGTRCGQVALVN